jgi:hypothetical protein
MRHHGAPVNRVLVQRVKRITHRLYIASQPAPRMRCTVAAYGARYMRRVGPGVAAWDARAGE